MKNEFGEGNAEAAQRLPAKTKLDTGGKHYLPGEEGQRLTAGTWFPALGPEE